MLPEMPRTTTFNIVATSSINEERPWEMTFTIPRAISQSDWEEIARLLKASMVTLSKLPIDNAIDVIEDNEDR